MPIQDGTNYTVRIARETTEGVAALVGAAALQLRSNPSPGLKLDRARIKANERRPDKTKSMDRLGYKTVTGSYNFDVTIGGVTDMLLEAIMRGGWVAAAALTTATGAGACVDLTPNATNQITRTGSGSFITDGWKEGDVARLTNHSVTADNNINLRVVSVAALVLTFAGTPLTIGAADTSCVLTRLKKVITQTPAVDYFHTVEQYQATSDLSKLYLGCKCTKFSLSLKPGEMATFTAEFMGMDRTLLITGTSPWFTTPTLTTGLGLIADESLIYVNGAAAAYITAFDLEFAITASGKPVLGSFVTPSIFTNDVDVTGTMSFMKTDFANDILFDAETEFAAGIMLVEPGAAPVGTLSIWLPRMKFAAGLDGPLGDDGPMMGDIPIAVAAAVATSTKDATIAVISSSAP